MNKSKYNLPHFISLSNTIFRKTYPLRWLVSEDNLILTNQSLVFLNRVALSERQAERIKEGDSATMAKGQENGITTLLGLKDYV
jgi:hypothetical protein